VAAFKSDLQGVLTDERDVPDEQLFGTEPVDHREASGCAGLTSTFSAWAGPAQLLAGVCAVVAVLPRDLHRLASTIDIDVDRKWIGVLQWSKA
jgi:hypothetical protein